MTRVTVAAAVLLIATGAISAAQTPPASFEMRDPEQATALSKRALQLPAKAKTPADIIRWMGKAPDFTVTRKTPDPQKIYSMERGESFILFWLNGPCNPIEISDANGRVAVASDGTAMCMTGDQPFPATRLPEDGNPIWCKNSPTRPHCGGAAAKR